MPGLRGEDDILKSFEGLDRVPGSKQKRRDTTPLADARRKQAFGESNGWDENPITKLLNGVETEFFTIGAFAQALEKSIVTIRLWEKKGFIPNTPYRLRSKQLNGKKVNGNRAYTRDLIEIAIEEFSRRGLLSTPRVEWKHHEDLTAALFTRWKATRENR